MSIIGGPIQLIVDGESIDVGSDEFKFDPATPKREAVMGANGLIGHTEKGGMWMIEGKVHWFGQFDLAKVVNAKDITVSMPLATGQTVTLTGAVYTGDGTVGTDSGELAMKFESKIGSVA